MRTVPPRLSTSIASSVAAAAPCRAGLGGPRSAAVPKYPGARARTPGPTLPARARASSAQSISARPASGTKAFGPPAPSRSPEPAAATTAEAGGPSGRRLGPEALLQQLVEVGLGPVLVLAERVHELRREDLLLPRVHLLLASGETLLPLSDP